MAGKTLNDRKLASEVRTLSLRAIKAALNGKDADFKKQLLLRLAPTVLPRITEFSGEDGGPMIVKLVSYGDNASA